MKKIILLMTLTLVLMLTGCSEDPFEAPKDGYHLIETDTFTLIHDNGIEETELFSYTFDHTYFVFTKDVQDINEVHYDFTNINNYKDISDDFFVFISSFDFIETDETSKDYGNKVDFSKGASGNDYNYKTVSINGDATDVYASISTLEGVQIRATYTIFDTEEGMLYIPSYVVIETVDLHQSYHYNFLSDVNEYNETNVAIVDFYSRIVALPPKTAFELEYEVLKESDIVDEAYFQRIYSHELNYFGEYDVCGSNNTEDCVETEYYKLQAQVYNTTIDDVHDFYIENFRGNYDGTGFYFISDNTTFRITEIEEAEVTDTSGNRITVVNMIIEFY